MNYIVIDLEFNQYFDFGDEKNTDEPQCPFEIIQIGVVKLDECFEFVDKKSFFVKPQIFRRIHPYVQRITRITAADLKHEKYFDEVFDDFVKFIGNEKYVFCVWGSSDIKLLFKNVLFYKLNSKLLSKKYINVQQMATEYFGQPQSTTIGLRAAVLKLELVADIDFHDALNDALYTSIVFKAVKTDSIKPYAFNLSQLNQSTFAKINSINSGLLFRYCEKELNRKLSDREKELMLKVYANGQIKKFDKQIKKTDTNTMI